MDMVALIFGMGFVGLILICLVWTILTYIFNNVDGTTKSNKKLIDNMNKMNKQRQDEIKK